MLRLVFAGGLRGAAPLRSGLRCSQPAALGAARHFSCSSVRPALARTTPRPMAQSILRPWRLGGGSARTRLLCTPAADSAGQSSAVRQALSWATENRTVVGVLLGSVLVMYGFYRVSVRVMKFFFNVSDKQIFNIGFAVGALTFAAIFAAGFATHRYLNLHLDEVYRAAVNELRKNDAVEKALGGFWAPGGFRGYALETWEEAVKGSERRVRSSFLEAPARRVQMIFTVKGATKDGMVSLEAYKRSGEYHFEMLSLDVAGGEHLFLLGDDDHALFPDVSAMLQKP